MVTWDRRPCAFTTVGPNRVTNGILDFSSQRIPIFNANRNHLFCDAKLQLLCAIIGYISNLSELKNQYRIESETDTGLICQLYHINGPEFIRLLDGVFTIFIYDVHRQVAFIFQDEYASNLPVYFANLPTQFIFSTQLKQILKYIPACQRQLDHTSVYNFLFHRKIIPTDATLVHNIHKLLPEKYLAIDFTKKSIEVLNARRPVEKLPVALAKQALLPAISKSIGTLLQPLDQEKAISMTLSAGFDTNLVLYLLRKKTSARVKAVTIGGRKRNEISAAQQIVSNYDQVEHITQTINPHLIDAFPDIVWRTEGYVYNDGLFLQYLLAGILNAQHSRLAFLGDCADQQLDFFRNSDLYKFKVNFRRFCKRTFLGSWYYTAIKHELPANPKIDAFLYHFKKYARNEFPYRDLDYDFILKKSGLMLNSFGIQGIYPFLNRDIRKIAKSLGWLNSHKRFYKSEVRKLIGAQVGQMVRKADGRTDIEYLLEERLALILKIFKSRLMQKLLLPSEILMLQTHPHHYPSLIMQLTQIFIFHELFISGRYDHFFESESLKIPLPALISFGIHNSRS